MLAYEHALATDKQSLADFDTHINSHLENRRRDVGSNAEQLNEADLCHVWSDIHERNRKSHALS